MTSYDHGMIDLVDMPADEVGPRIEAIFAEYTTQRIAAGDDPDQARAEADAQRAQLFPDGSPVDGQHVMRVVADGEAVGTVWMGRPLRDASATWFVFYVEIDEAHRGRGLGRAAMEAAEAWSQARGGARISLNVFGPNVVARRLYDSLGYQVMATVMYKDLDGGSPGVVDPRDAPSL